MIIRTFHRSIILCTFLFFAFTANVFSADDNVPSGSSGTGLVDCLQSCETEYTKCGSSWLCDLQGAKCTLKCAVAKTEGATSSGNISVVVTIQQKSNLRYLDAHESVNKDYRLVTRTKQNNSSQHWILTSLGNNVFTLKQKSNGRFADAHEHDAKDFGLVTRTNQNNNTQRWIIKGVANGLSTIQQKSNGRYMDAHVTAGRDFEVVTRTRQNNNTQRWLIKPVDKISFNRIKNKVRRGVSNGAELLK